MEPIIQSILDSDLYSFTQQQFIRHNQPRLKVEYEFKCRNEGVDLSPYADEIREQISHFCTLSATEDEVQWLEGTIKYLSSDYTRSLRDLKLNKDCVKISKQGEPFTITITGNWYETILFEVPILSIVNEVYFSHHPFGQGRLLQQGRDILQEKIQWLKTNADVPFNLLEFGTRRRYSRNWQKEVVGELERNFGKYSNASSTVNFIGTSNVKLAQEFNITPMGTMSHQLFMAYQALAPLHHFQSEALQAWADEYRGYLGIALSDCVGFDAFLRDFHKGFAMLYTGCRNDSGDPIEWGEKLIAHYRSFDIDPLTKTAVFSDALNYKTSLKIARHFNLRIRCQFGIGTFQSCDMGVPALNIVIKMTRVNDNGQWLPVAKLSDSPGKEMCKDEVYVAWLKKVVGK